MSATRLVGEPSTSTQVMTLDDFITGLLAGLAAQDVRVISIREQQQFYAAIEEAYKLLAEIAEEQSIELLFHVALNRVYLDSPDVREAITRAVQRDLVSLDNPEYQDMRLKVSANAADGYLRDLPGGRELFRSLADRFLEHYPG